MLPSAASALFGGRKKVQEVLGAMNQDSGVEAVSLKVDGGMTANALLMQFQADLLGVQVLLLILIQKQH